MTMCLTLYSNFAHSLAIRDYWDLGKEGAKDDKFIVLVSMAVIFKFQVHLASTHTRFVHVYCIQI